MVGLYYGFWHKACFVFFILESVFFLDLTTWRMRVDDYFIALNAIYFVCLAVVLRKLFGNRYNLVSPQTVSCKRAQTKRTDPAKKSLLERIRDWTFPKIPMV